MQKKHSEDRYHERRQAAADADGDSLGSLRMTIVYTVSGITFDRPRVGGRIKGYRTKMRGRSSARVGGPGELFLQFEELRKRCEEGRFDGVLAGGGLDQITG